MNNISKGKIGEHIAEEFLKENDVDIINKNYYTKFGEIDLIGLHNQTIIFVEVKLRMNSLFGTADESITTKKIQNITRSIEVYLNKNNFHDFSIRLDIITIDYESNEKYRLNWLKNVDFY